MYDIFYLQSGKLSAAVGVPAGFSSGAANLPRIAGGQGEASAPPRCLGGRQAGRIIGRYGPFRYVNVHCIIRWISHVFSDVVRSHIHTTTDRTLKQYNNLRANFQDWFLLPFFLIN